MIVTCAFCGKQIIDDHDCPEKRAALIEAANIAQVFGLPIDSVHPLSFLPEDVIVDEGKE